MMAKLPGHLVRMKSKFEGECSKCPYPIWKGAWMVWNKNKNTARHERCPKNLPVMNGRQVRFVAGKQ